MTELPDIAISDIVDEFNSRSAESDKERRRLQALIARHQRKMDSLPRINHMSTVDRIADEIAQRLTGYSIQRYGPFGLGSEYSFSLHDENGSVAFVEFRAGVGARPVMIGDETTLNYPEGSIGAMNGFNKRPRQLPSTIDAFVRELQDQIDDTMRRRAEESKTGANT